MDFAIELDKNEALPLYRRLANALRESIELGRLQPGDAMPSSRHLSKSLGFSRITVVHSYDELVSQGYLNTVTGSGTFVRARQNLSNARPSDLELDMNTSGYSDIHLSEYSSRIMKLQTLTSTSADQPELNFGAPPTELLPLKQWRQLLLKHCRTHITKRLDASVDPMGFLPLREAIAAYLRRSRNLDCTADRIAVFAGSQQTVNLVTRLLINESDKVALENPGFVFARKTIRALGAQVVPVAVDSEGLIVSQLNSHPDCKVVYVTPSHHDPTGAVMSLPRRNELLNWAAQQNAYIIEDDYDCEYNYGTPALPALQGLDRHESVIYISTFWKILFPLMPIGFVVVPLPLIPILARAKTLAERNFSMLEQYALTDFINDGLLERHIRKTRKIFALRRQSLISSLTHSLGDRVTIPKYSSGMHIAVRFNLPLTDEEILRRSREAGLPIVSTEAYYVTGHRSGEFLISFAGKASENVQDLVNKFAQSLT